MNYSFLSGLGLGTMMSSIALFLFMRLLQKRALHKLKRSHAAQQDDYECQLQRQAENHILELSNQANQFQAAIDQLEQQLAQHSEEKETLLQHLQQTKKLNRANQKELLENNREIDEVLDSLARSQEKIIQSKDEEIQQLQRKIQDYAIALEEQKPDESTFHKQHSNRGDRLDADQIESLLLTIFPNISLLRDSLNILIEQPEHLNLMVKALKDIVDGQAYGTKKVRATDNKWTECRVPHLTLMRLYYQKCKQKSGYQVLISPKKNQKSQDQDYAWLKHHSTC